MKSIYIIMAILALVTIVGMVTISAQQASAFGFVERKEFKKLTNEFVKDVEDAAIGNPEIIPGLVDDYGRAVKALFETPSTSP